MYQIVNFVPPAPSTMNPAVPELVDYIVAKMLAKPPDERYQGAHEVANDLRECEAQLGVNVSTTQPPLRPPAAGLATGDASRARPDARRTKVIAQTVSRTRGVDAAAPAAETRRRPRAACRIRSTRSRRRSASRC